MPGSAISPLRRLPSLNALRAFEAAARLSSFTAAAEELHVTVSAISHQIRQLEEVLEVPLFHRASRGASRGITLTDSGRQLLPDIQTGFHHLAEGVARLQAARPAGLLTISMLSTFAMRWFLPRLPTFQARHPEIELRLSTSVRPVHLEREGFDCAIRYGHGNWPDLHVTRLLDETLTPVCSPTLLNGPHPLVTPDDLRLHHLLHAKLRPDDWSMWLHAAGCRDVTPAAGTILDTRNLTIQAALQGYGVAVVDPTLVADELRTGLLVRPFETIAALSGAYFLVCPPALAQSPRISRLRDWLIEECEPESVLLSKSQAGLHQAVTR